MPFLAGRIHGNEDWHIATALGVGCGHTRASVGMPPKPVHHETHASRRGAVGALGTNEHVVFAGGLSRILVLSSDQPPRAVDRRRGSA